MPRKPTLPPAKKAGPALPPGAKLPPRPKKPSGPSKLEAIKSGSQALRGSLVDDLQTDAPKFDEAGKQLLKFHGIYQQDDRDNRSGGRVYSFMVRSRIPGGRLTAEQYLAHDAVAEAFADGTLRVTTRQGIQFHGILKGDLQASLRQINEALVTTFAACGDVVRNVMASAAPRAGRLYREIDAVADALAERLLPQTRAYHEVWIDGEKAFSGAEPKEEPLYGRTYLPRKFKIGIAPPGDNSVDVYTQDVGLVAVAEAPAGDGGAAQLAGFNVLVGGGLGMTHKKPETFPRLADPLAFVPVREVVRVVEEIVKVQRDHGDRANRKHARMKYLIHDWGLPKFRRELERRLGYALAPPRPVPPLDLELHLGWHAQGDGRFFYGISVENGRIKDEGPLRLRTALREAVRRFRPGVHLTPTHDVLLTDLRPEDRPALDALLDAHGVPRPEALSAARRFSMACPALPTCGLAIAESERVLPHVIDQVEADLGALGLGDETLTIRMTGCPNGCARPYVADVAFVGRSLDAYTVYLGGRPDGTRLNEPYADLVPLGDLALLLRPLFALWKEERRPGEGFGDYCHRVGLSALRERTETAAASPETSVAAEAPNPPSSTRKPQ